MIKRPILAIEISLVVLLLLLYGSSFAQYTPEPLPVNPDQENPLLLRLQQAVSDTAKIRICLSLSNLYYNKPLKDPTDLDKGMSFAQRGRSLSFGAGDLPDYNRAQQLIALILIDKDSLPAAEDILKSVNDSMRADLSVTICNAYLYQQTGTDEENLAGVLRLGQQAGSLALRLHQPVIAALALQYLALYHLSRGENVPGDSLLTEAIHQQQVIRSPKLQYAYYDRAQVQVIRGNYDKALADMQEAISLMSSSGDSLEAGDFYYFLGIIINRFGQHQKVLENYKLAMHYYETHAGHDMIYDAIRAISLNLISDRQYQQALDFTLASYRRYPPVNVNALLEETGCLADCYLKLKKYDQAEKYFLREFNMRKRSNSLGQTAYHRMAFFYVESRQYAKARPYLLQALKQQNALTLMTTKNHLQYMLFLTDSAAGDYLSAIRHLSLTKRYDDTVYKQEKVKEIQKLNVQYETESKNQQIQLLHEKDLLQTAHLRQAMLVRNITIGGILLLVLAGGLLYGQYRQKQLANAAVIVKNVQLEKLIIEKEWLLKEVHHRVKNNLHTVICLLDIQAEFLKGDALVAIGKIQNRIYAMSLIHQKLYLTNDVTSINIADYLRELVDYLKDSFGNQQRIHFELDLESVALDVSKAMPLGLIVNEAVSNSIKYAFPSNVRGIIAITLKHIGDKIVLGINDNGIGFVDKPRQPELNSLGLKLIKGLSEDLNADMKVDSRNGTKITISFSPYMPGDDVPDELPNKIVYDHES